MDKVITPVFLLTIGVKFVSSYADGAPPLSCVNMRPDHLDPRSGDFRKPQFRPSPYKFTARWDQRTRMIRVSISGERIQGFLIQGRLHNEGPAVGSFINIAENAKYQNCSLLPKVIF